MQAHALPDVIGEVVCCVVGEKPGPVEVGPLVEAPIGSVPLLVEDVIDGERHDVLSGLQPDVSSFGSWMLKGGIRVQSNLE